MNFTAVHKKDEGMDPDDDNPDDVDDNVETMPLIHDSSAEVARSKATSYDSHGTSPLVEKVLALFGIGRLVQQFGHKLLITLFVSQHLVKGFAASFTAPCAQYIFAAYKVKGPQLQLFGGVAQLPWAMKPVIGLVSDAFPISGYHKAPYILVASFFGIIACAVIGSVSQEHLSVDRVVTGLFLLQLQYSTCDLLTEAKYAEKMQSHPDAGPALMTYVWFGLQGGALVAIALVGPVIRLFGPKVPYLIALVPASCILIPIWRNYLEEVPKSPEEVALLRNRLLSQKEACILCLLMFLGTITLTVLGIAFENVTVNAMAAITVACVMLVSFSVLLRPLIAKVNAFFLIQTSLGFSISGASFYFYTDTPEQYPEGPHFSLEFYTSVLGIVGAMCSLLGIWTYQRFASSWSYRGLLLMTNVVLSLLNVTDVILFTRTNVRLGVPDHAFVLGASVFMGVIQQWMWMPGVVILSQLCPKGMEATMYALLAGCHNLGNTIASNCGALVLQLLGCQPGGVPHESEQFKNLWLGSALSTVLPMLTLLLLPWLIPDAKQTEKLLADDDRDATEGSLWRRWSQRQFASTAASPAQINHAVA